METPETDRVARAGRLPVGVSVTRARARGTGRAGPAPGRRRSPAVSHEVAIGLLLDRLSQRHPVVGHRHLRCLFQVSPPNRLRGSATSASVTHGRAACATPKAPRAGSFTTGRDTAACHGCPPIRGRIRTRAPRPETSTARRCRSDPAPACPAGCTTGRRTGRVRPTARRRSRGREEVPRRESRARFRRLAVRAREPGRDRRSPVRAVRRARARRRVRR